jgi:hypothetical protein
MNMTCAVELTLCLPHGCLSVMKLYGTSGPFVSNGMNATFTNIKYTDVHFVCVCVCGLCAGHARAVVEE